MEKQANELGQELIDLRQSAVPYSWADDLSTQNYTSCGKNSSILPHTRPKKSLNYVLGRSEIQSGGGEIPQSRGHS